MGICSALGGGFGLRYWVNSRKFNRRSTLGIEQFNDYSDKLTSTFVETVGSILANLMIGAGLAIFLMLAARYQLAGLV
jgi:hypothetical protein